MSANSITAADRERYAPSRTVGQCREHLDPDRQLLTVSKPKTPGGTGPEIPMDGTCRPDPDAARYGRRTGFQRERTIAQIGEAPVEGCGPRVRRWPRAISRFATHFNMRLRGEEARDGRPLT
jgi:hypothetical protein